MTFIIDKTMKLVCLYVIVCILLFVGVYGQLCPTCLAGPGIVENVLINVSNEIKGGQRISESLVEGRGKKKKKMKNTSMNMMLGGSVMIGFLKIFMFLNTITVILGKAFLFTFISKFLLLINLLSHGSPPKKNTSSKRVTVVMK